METHETIDPRGTEAGAKKVEARKRRARKRRRRAKADAAARPRVSRTFPAASFEESLALGLAIQQFAAGQKVRRLTLFDNLKKSPDSGPSRQLVTNSSKYGITKGSYKAEYLELTQDGRLATSPEVSSADALRARFKLSIDQIPPFKSLYEHMKGNKLPALAVLRDFLLEQGHKDAEVAECIDTFIVNAKFLGLLRTVAGAERVLPIDHLLEEMPRTPSREARPVQVPPGLPAAAATTKWNQVCFYVTPIGSPDSEERKHADLFLSSLVEPALEEFGLEVIRADQIGKPGMITAQVIEHIVRSRLVVADLSYHNPNVFYELSLRHACRLPTVQLIRLADKIPFDLDQFRTVQIDTTNIFTLVSRLESYRAEIANQVRRVLADVDAVDNPLTVFFPGISVTIPALPS